MYTSVLVAAMAWTSPPMRTMYLGVLMVLRGS
jgi:hypothetical protein